MSPSQNPAVRRPDRAPRTVLALIVGFLGLAAIGTLPARGQTPPGYNALFQDSPRTDQLTQADLPNLGRLVVLEATSMFVHARSDLADSTESSFLLNEITTVWQAADAFVAAMSYYPTEAERLDAGRLAFPSLEVAFDRLRDTIGRFPGSSQRVTLNLGYMSRPMAVIPPLLGQNPPTQRLTPAAEPVLYGPSLATVRELLRELLPLIQSLRAEMIKPEPAEDKAISHELEVLASLVAGLDWIAFGRADQPDLVASVRPITSLAQRLDLRLRRRGLVEPQQSLWNALEQRIDALAAQFRLPREIIPLGAQTKPPVNLGMVTTINEAINQIEPILGRLAQGTTAGAAPASGLVTGDLQRLRTRLFLLRQHFLAQGSPARIAQAIRDVDSDRAQVDDDASAIRSITRGEMDKLFRSVREATKTISEEIGQEPRPTGNSSPAKGSE